MSGPSASGPSPGIRRSGPRRRDGGDRAVHRSGELQVDGEAGARAAAIENLGALAGSLPEQRAAIRAKLIGLIGDPHFAARRAAVYALGDTKDLAALPILRDLARNAYESGLRRRARDGVRKILAGSEEDADDAGERLDELELANESLRGELEALRRELQPVEEGEEN